MSKNTFRIKNLYNYSNASPQTQGDFVAFDTGQKDVKKTTEINPVI